MHFFSWQTWSNFKTHRTNGAPYLLHCTNGTYAIKSMEIKTRRLKEGLRDFDFGIKFTWFCHQDFCMLTSTITFFHRRPNYYDIVRSINVSRKEMKLWYQFVLDTYKMYNITSPDQVWNGDETAISAMDNVPYVDSAVATSVRIFGKSDIFLKWNVAASI